MAVGFEKTLNKELGLQLKRRRKEANLTQEQLAEIIGVKRSVISKYENGTISPSLETAAKIIIVTKFGLSKGILEVLFYGQNHP